MRIFIFLLLSFKLTAQSTIFHEGFFSFSFSGGYQVGLKNVKSLSELEKSFYAYHNNYAMVNLLEIDYFIKDRLQIMVGLDLSTQAPSQVGYQLVSNKFPNQIIESYSTSIPPIAINNYYTSIGYKPSQLPLMVYFTAGRRDIGLIHQKYLIREPNSNQIHTIFMDYDDDSLSIRNLTSKPLIQLASRYFLTNKKKKHAMYVEAFFTRFGLGSDLFYQERNENTGEIIRQEIKMKTSMQAGIKLGMSLGVYKRTKKVKK
jgi:hypothetical protein